MVAEESFYWFDYETFGTHPAWDRPAQFAGVRTDMQLNVIGEPLVIFCRLPADYLPNPIACRITGITPQQVNERGVIEASFISTILDEIGKPGTCSVGYNSIRFDDEFTRHTLFRNLFDPYEYEWKDGNSRWDLLDVVRLTRALRPEGIQWPNNPDGSATNRLEHLSKANGIEHSQAHDAMSDVWATLGIARLIREKQPKLFDYAFTHRSKANVAAILNVKQRTACLQVSGMIPGNRHHISAVIPLALHPDNANSIIVLDLHQDPSELAGLSAEEITHRLYRPAATGTTTTDPTQSSTGAVASPALARPGLRTIQINKCPVLVPMSTLREVDALRLGINKQQIHDHLQRALTLLNADFIEKVATAMTRSWDEAPRDVDGSLYSGAFFSQVDKQRQALFRTADPAMLHAQLGQFDDARLNELGWRYLARNYPEFLDQEQKERWDNERKTRLYDSSAPWLDFNEFRELLDTTEWLPGEAELVESLRRYSAELEESLRRIQARNTTAFSAIYPDSNS